MTTTMDGNSPDEEITKNYCGGISKRFLTGCRRVGLSRPKKAVGINQINSTRQTGPAKIDEQQQVERQNIKPEPENNSRKLHGLKRKSDLDQEETPSKLADTKILDSDRFLEKYKNVGNETAACSSLNTENEEIVDNSIDDSIVTKNQTTGNTSLFNNETNDPERCNSANQIKNFLKKISNNNKEQSAGKHSAKTTNEKSTKNSNDNQVESNNKPSVKCDSKFFDDDSEEMYIKNKSFQHTSQPQEEENDCEANNSEQQKIEASSKEILSNDKKKSEDKELKKQIKRKNRKNTEKKIEPSNKSSGPSCNSIFEDDCADFDLTPKLRKPRSSHYISNSHKLEKTKKSLVTLDNHLNKTRNTVKTKPEVNIKTSMNSSFIKEDDDDDDDDDQFTSTPKQTQNEHDQLEKLVNQMEMDLKEQTNELDKLKHAQQYRKLNKLETLKQMSNTWMDVFNAAFHDLLIKLREQNDLMDRETLLKKLGISENIFEKIEETN